MNQQIKIWKRNLKIQSQFLNKYVLIHNGKDFKRLFVKREHIGFKFGEFCLTKFHNKKTKNKKNLNGSKRKSNLYIKK